VPLTPLRAPILTKDDIENRGAVLFLVEVTLMFLGLFVAAVPIWLQVTYFILAVALAVVVLQTARSAVQVIPASFPFQRPFGVALYLSAHTMQFFVPAPMPLEMVVFVLFALPIAMMLLFY